MNVHEYVEQFYNQYGSNIIIKPETPAHWRPFLKLSHQAPSEMFDLTEDGWQLADGFHVDECDVDNFVKCCDELNEKGIES